MKRTLSLLLCAALLVLLLAGCSAEVGGKYTLVRITAEGKEITPANLSVSAHFTLEEKGSGSASWNGSAFDITWTQEGKTVYLSGENGILKLTQSGKNLVCEQDGALWVFEPAESDD